MWDELTHIESGEKSLSSCGDLENPYIGATSKILTLVLNGQIDSWYKTLVEQMSPITEWASTQLVFGVIRMTALFHNTKHEYP